MRGGLPQGTGDVLIAMLRNLAAGAGPALLVLAGCGAGSDRPDSDATGKAAPANAAAPIMPLPEGEAAGTQPAGLPRYVGGWAADPALCGAGGPPAPAAAPTNSIDTASRVNADPPRGASDAEAGVWRFGERSLESPNAECDFDAVISVTGGYDVAAQCLSGGEPAIQSFTIRFDADLGRMTLNSPLWGERTLERCPAG